MPTFGQHIVDCLVAHNIDCVFGIPGVHTIELYRGLAGKPVRHVTPRHEQGAGFMADGYARACGKPGVCFIITGPGLTNIATAMAQAYGDSIPMLVISTVNAVGEMGSGAGHLHELPNQNQLMRQFTAFSHTVLDPAEFETALARAFAIFSSARPRPVHIEIPVNLLKENCDHLPKPRPAIRVTPPTASAATVSRLTGFCQKAVRPLLIVGGGAAAAAKAITAIADKLQAPVLMTINGRGILPPGHPLGMSISAGSDAALAVMEEADHILAIGTELGPTDFDDRLSAKQHLGAKLTRVDIDPEQLIRGLRPEFPIVGDSRLVAEMLESELPARDRGWGQERARKANHAMQEELSPARRLQVTALETIRDTLPGALIVGDSNQPVYAACMAFAAERPMSFFNSATGYGTLGYGLPAAIGAKLACPERPVVSLMGDGGLQFSLPEMGAATEAGVPLILIVWNNRGYGEIEKAMVASAVEPIGVRIFTPDFSKLAGLFEWRYRLAPNLAALRTLLNEAKGEAGPVLIEIDETTFH
jgi:acetolactate synthase-1/2/3 large subunit